MLKIYIPKFTATSLFEIDPDSLLERNYKYLLLDLDNTIAAYYETEPSQAMVAHIESLKNSGIKVIIASNNFGKRVKHFANILGLDCYSLLAKPFPFRLKKTLKDHNINPAEAIMIGDQVMTDIASGNGAGIATLLVDPINMSKEPWTTRINRLFEKRLRRKILIEKLSKPWLG